MVLPVAEQLIRFSTEDGYVEEIGRLLQNGVDALFCPGGNAGMVAAYALSLYKQARSCGYFPDRFGTGPYFPVMPRRRRLRFRRIMPRRLRRLRMRWMRV